MLWAAEWNWEAHLTASGNCVWDDVIIVMWETLFYQNLYVLASAVRYILDVIVHAKSCDWKKSVVIGWLCNKPQGSVEIYDLASVFPPTTELQLRKAPHRMTNGPEIC